MCPTTGKTLSRRFIQPIERLIPTSAERLRRNNLSTYFMTKVLKGGPQGGSVFSGSGDPIAFRQNLLKALSDMLEIALPGIPGSARPRIHVQMENGTFGVPPEYHKLCEQVKAENRALLATNTQNRKVYFSGEGESPFNKIFTGFIESLDLTLVDLCPKRAPALLALPLVKKSGEKVGVVIVELPLDRYLLPHIDLPVFRQLSFHAAEMYHN